MKLLMVIHTGPFHDNTATLVGLARAAVAGGHEVAVFAMSEGAGNLAREDFASLPSQGVAMALCEKNCVEVKAPEGVPGVHYGSQYDLATMIGQVDRVISFT